MVGARRGDDHPHHIIVEIVAEPVVVFVVFEDEPIGPHAVDEIVVGLFECVEVALVAGSLVGVEHCLERLRFAPSAIAEGIVTVGAFAEIIFKEALAHCGPYFARKGQIAGRALGEGPLLLRGGRGDVGDLGERRSGAVGVGSERQGEGGARGLLCDGVDAGLLRRLGDGPPGIGCRRTELHKPGGRGR